MKHSKPNIIYIVCHDLGKHLGCYGARVMSPNLDRFAAQGVKFTQAFCNAPACSPSRGCAMTGLYSHNNGLMGLVNRGWSMPESCPTIVDYLNEAGYETVHFGFQHERYSARANRYKICGNDTLVETYAENAISRAIEYLESNKGSGKPFYMNIGTWEVHATSWQGNYVKERLEVYNDGIEDEAYIPDYTPDTLEIRKEMLKFQSCIRYLDKQVQRLFDTVERLGYEENTLVIFTTDHGIGNMRAKGTLYDRGTEITLLMQMPGTIGEGVVISELIQNIDITPTLLEVAGLEIPPSIQGRSFWKLLTGGEYTPHNEIFIERNYHGGYDPMRSVRTKRFHYIRNFGENIKKAWLPHEIPYMNKEYKAWYIELWPEPSLPREREELFDIVADPWEFNNLAYDPEYSEVKKDLAKKMERWMESTNDPLLQGEIPDKLYGWPENYKKKT